MGSTDNRAIMTIDLKRSRFRIHKSTLNVALQTSCEKFSYNLQKRNGA